MTLHEFQDATELERIDRLHHELLNVRDEITAQLRLLDEYHALGLIQHATALSAVADQAATAGDDQDSQFLYLQHPKLFTAIHHLADAAYAATQLQITVANAPCPNCGHHSVNPQHRQELVNNHTETALHHIVAARTALQLHRIAARDARARF